MSNQMINSRQAATSLSLPHYWFRQSEIRAKHRIPHYLLVGVVRFRVSELEAWAANISRNQAIDEIKTQTIEGDQ